MTPPKATSKSAETSGEDDDAVREDEPPPAHRERVRQEAIEREDAAEARKVGEARVRREREHGDDRAHRDVVERAPPEDGARELREHALVAVAPGLGRADAVRAREERDAAEQDHQDRDDDRERPLRGRDRRLAEDRARRCSPPRRRSSPCSRSRTRA